MSTFVAETSSETLWKLVNQPGNSKSAQHYKPHEKPRFQLKLNLSSGSPRSWSIQAMPVAGQTRSEPNAQAHSTVQLNLQDYTVKRANTVRASKVFAPSENPLLIDRKTV